MMLRCVRFKLQFQKRIQKKMALQSINASLFVLFFLVCFNLMLVIFCIFIFNTIVLYLLEKKSSLKLLLPSHFLKQQRKSIKK